MKQNTGHFCWTELATTDTSKAKDFYKTMFDWEFNEVPMHDAGHYIMANIAGGSVGGIFTMNDQMKGVPPHWMNYVEIENADNTAKKATSLGGTIIVEPFDVMQMGRMAVIQDPTKAVISIWQHKSERGGLAPAELPGAVGWRELMTNNVETAGKFYSELFNWNPEVQDMGTFKYTSFKVGDTYVGGMMPITAEMGPIPPHWGTYFTVKNCDDAHKLALQNGAQCHVEPSDIPGMGKFAAYSDPTGAAFLTFEFAQS